MQSSPSCVDDRSVMAGRYVPLWDFDAPADSEDPVRDSSAGVIAANGMLIMSNAFLALGRSSDADRFLHMSTTVVQHTLDLCYAGDELQLSVEQSADGKPKVIATAVTGTAQPFAALLRCATANYNKNWTDKYYNHGLVYGDYYLLEYGNRLLQLGYI